MMVMRRRLDIQGIDRLTLGKSLANAPSRSIDTWLAKSSKSR